MIGFVGLVTAGWLWLEAGESDDGTGESQVGDHFEAPRDTTEACEARAAGSRWTVESGWERAGRFGGASEEWIVAAVGIEFGPDRRLYLYDPQAPRIVALSANLSRVQYIGKEGPGPGELRSIPAFTVRGNERNWLTGSDASLFVYHARAISRFDYRGRYLGDVAGFRPPGSYLTLHSIGYSPTDSVLLYVHDPGVGMAAAGERVFTTWRAGSQGPERVFGVELPSLPNLPTGGSFTGPRQAYPLWALYEECVLVSDGAHPWVIRHELRTDRQDTLTLPEVDLPPPGASERVTRSMERLKKMQGLNWDGIPEPSAIRRWVAMTVDPDGHLWILSEVARRSGPPYEVLRLNVETGEVSASRVPAFPRAFGRPGEFYAVVRDTSLGLSVVERYVGTDDERR